MEFRTSELPSELALNSAGASENFEQAKFLILLGLEPSIYGGKKVFKIL
jgi:hypothetical protein